MDIRQLNYFVQVADCGSYSLASQKLFISQPALSKAIKNIEDEMGFTFFYTSQRKQKLTDAGQAFYEKAVKLLESYDELIKVTYMEEQIDKGHLRIGLSVAAGPALFSHILPAFKKAYPMITFSIMEKETNLLKEAVMKKDLDIAYIDMLHFREPEDSDVYDVYKLCKSEIGLVANVNNPLANLKKIDYKDLDEQRLILFGGQNETAGQVESAIKESGVKTNVVLASTQWNFIMDMIGNDMGVVLSPYYMYSKFKNSKIRFVPMHHDIGQREIGLIVKKGDYRTRACMNFLKMATEPGVYEGIMDTLCMPENEPME